MRFFLTITTCFLVTFLFAQPTGNIEIDTAKAHELCKQAEKITADGAKLQMNLLITAYELYKPYQIYEKEIEIKSRLAYAAYDAFEDSLSEVYAHEAIDLAKKQLNDELRNELYYSYYTILRLYHLSNLQMALEYGKKAVAVAVKPSDKYFDATFFVITNHIYNEDIASAELLIKEVEGLMTDDTWAFYLAPLYRAKMLLSFHQRNPEKAISFGRQCLIANQKQPYFSTRETGPISVEIGNALRALGDYKGAIQAIKDGMEYTKPTGGYLATYYVSLATNYEQLEDTERAIELYKQAIKLYEQEPTTYRVHLHVTNQILSMLYYKMMDYEQALVYVQAAFLYGKTPRIKLLYASILRPLGQYDEALKLIQEAIIDVSTHFEGEDIYSNPSESEVYSNAYLAAGILRTKVFILVDRGVKHNNSKDIKEGLKTGELTKGILHEVLEKMNGFEESKLINIDEFQSLYNNLIKGEYHLSLLENEYATAVFNTIEERKSVLLLETLTPSKLPDSLALQQKGLVAKMKKQEQKLSLATKDSTDYYQTLLFEANNQLEVFLKELNKDYPKEAYSFYNTQPTTLGEIQQDLEEEAIILEYIYTGNDLYIYLISGTSKKIIKTTLGKDFNDKVAQLNSYLKNPLLIQQSTRKKFIQLSNELYQLLIAPASKELAGKSKLIIIPDGKLFLIPFEVLLASNESKDFHELDFLIKDFEISYQYSATIYHQLKQKAAISNKSFLGFAPVFKNGQTIDMANRSANFIVDSLYRSIEGDKFISLPNSKIEIETIAKNIASKGGNAKILLEAAATKNALIQSLKKQPYQFVHIATHGIVNFQNAKLSALVCFGNSNNAESSLFFASEIQRQDIQADLVVLSSCESGIGRLVGGEGLIALNRSFIYSGANNVMFSLWKVNDKYSSQLMIDFYKSYLTNNSYSAALRQTKLKMLQNPITANPRYWAAFVLIGE